jgi:NO-binding membrane sensor protein with MHYT domain
MSWGPALGVAVTFVWLGMVLAISFLEAPLKFRAPGVTLPIGLAIGRLVFRGLNAAEVVLGVAVVVATVVGYPTLALVFSVVALAALVAQLAAVRPFLHRRTEAVLAGDVGQRSQAHLAYIALEGVKVLALLGAGITLLTA